MCGDMLAAFIIIKTVLMHTFVDVFLESAMNMYKKIQTYFEYGFKRMKEGYQCFKSQYYERRISFQINF